MKACPECGRDVLFLADCGAEPSVCGLCGTFLCPLCVEHKICASKIAAANRRLSYAGARK